MYIKDGDEQVRSFMSKMLISTVFSAKKAAWAAFGSLVSKIKILTIQKYLIS